MWRKGFPEWLQRVEVPKKGGTVRHALIMDAASLQWVVNQNTITPHVWTSRVPTLGHSDISVFDLDPADDGDPEMLRRTTLMLRDLLLEHGHQSWVKTSGSKGFHIVVPWDVEPRRAASAARFANRLGRLLVERDPTHLTQEFSKVDRKGRIYVDTGRNGYSATFAAAYAVRPKPGAPVSAPCSWEEVSSGAVGPRTFTVRNMSRARRTGRRSLGRPGAKVTAGAHVASRSGPDVREKIQFEGTPSCLQLRDHVLGGVFSGLTVLSIATILPSLPM